MNRFLGDIALQPSISVADLKLKPKNVMKEKWDWSLPPALLMRSYATSELDLQGISDAAKLLIDGGLS